MCITRPRPAKPARVSPLLCASFFPLLFLPLLPSPIACCCRHSVPVPHTYQNEPPGGAESALYPSYGDCKAGCAPNTATAPFFTATNIPAVAGIPLLEARTALCVNAFQTCVRGVRGRRSLPGQDRARRRLAWIITCRLQTRARHCSDRRESMCVFQYLQVNTGALCRNRSGLGDTGRSSSLALMALM